WDTDGDGVSDFVELHAAAWPLAEGAPGADGPRWIDRFCCLDGGADARAACLDTVRAHLAAEAARRGCPDPAAEAAARTFATDPLWAADSPAHHVAPGDPIGGGACSAARTARDRSLSGFLLPALAALLAMGAARGVGRPGRRRRA
ncbi:MAG: hypothetical protein FJ087_21155, partial [Deltaproteobacteria bacterium]|nr:hypothetical protein [Deltaproteobacteria bacterium]